MAHSLDTLAKERESVRSERKKEKEREKVKDSNNLIVSYQLLPADLYWTNSCVYGIVKSELQLKEGEGYGILKVWGYCGILIWVVGIGNLKNLTNNSFFI